MQIGVDSRRLVERGDSDRELAELCPILPSDVAHQAEVMCDLVECAAHHLLRLCRWKTELRSADSPADSFGNRTETREERSKAKVKIVRRLIGESDAKLRNRNN